MKKTITNTKTRDTWTITNTAHGTELAAMDLDDLINYLEDRGEMDNMTNANVMVVKNWIETHREDRDIEAARLARTKNGEVTIINGRHRLYAFWMLGLKTIWVEWADHKNAA